ncbi:MAG: DUF6051 family protein [Candidatus Azobacteroides sp.]|nr:DUF6051 family protein [Candidatus Azobacteroides sp.]
MNILLRTLQLENLFSLERKTELKDSGLEIHPFQFETSFNVNEIKNIQENLPLWEFSKTADEYTNENKVFNYTVFAPSGKEKSREAILLLHGLNERSWKKYLVWAEYLAQTTRKPVILFPLAFHINRTPLSWINPRMIRPWVDQRNRECPGVENSTFVNVALSSRLSQEPLRFYTSGVETISNLQQLTKEIKSGKHPLFKEDTSVDLFAYSIGALISEILLLANPEKLFSDSRLFMFCGGSIFCAMNANARDILDSAANEQIHHYYSNDFLKNPAIPGWNIDSLKKAFKAMIHPQVFQEYREKFFQQAGNRIRAIALKGDTVIPTQGIIAAMGKISSKIMEEWDFPFPYSHQWPFPLNSKAPENLISENFERVFSRAAYFLG